MLRATLKLTAALAAAFFAAVMVSSSAQEITDQEYVDPEFDARVRAEVERLINEEGMLNTAIERGIENYIREQRAAAERAKLANMREVDPARDHILGDIDAPVTLVEYSDFECPFCKRFHPTVAKLLENNPGQIRWVYRHYPLGFHNPGAERQAEASECVAELAGNDAFWKYADEIYARTTAGGNGFPLTQLRPLAEEVGVDGESFAECLSSRRLQWRVRDDYENGVSMGINGTPGGVLVHKNGAIESFAGAFTLGQMQQLFELVSQ